MISSILLLGDIVLDKNYCGEATSLSPEGPYPVVRVQNIAINVGCIGNITASALPFFENIFLITCLKDADSSVLQEHISPKVNHINVSQSNRQLPVINRVVVGNYCVSRFDEENDVPLSIASEEEIIKQVGALVQSLHVVLLNDYGRGFLTPNICARIIELCRLNSVPVLVDPYTEAWDKFKGVDLIKPNRTEATAFFGKNISRDNFSEFAEVLLNDFDVKHVLCTLDEDGMIHGWHSDEDKQVEIIYKEAIASHIVDVIGCGDAIITAIAVLYYKHNCTFPAPKYMMDFLAGIGSIAVSTAGCYHLIPEDFRKLEENHGEEHIERKVVFTNGCFDVIHPGHIRLLKECRKLGTYLIVGINTDNGTQKNKGETRPVNTLEDRIAMLKELDIADKIVPFDDKSVGDLVKKIRPDVLVKGGDYVLTEIHGREYAKETVIVEMFGGYSSTKIINKIRNQHT